MEKTALIGYTGFVGSNINDQYNFTHTYNTKNISDIHEQSYDLVVSSATYAEMWRINQDPEGDITGIKRLMTDLGRVSIDKLVLISTVGVYEDAKNVDELTPINETNLTPYGKHRLMLEQYCSDNFDTLIVRLPGLFGKGLKKNVIYDLMNNNMVENIHRDGVYQYYNLDNIWADINTALDADLNMINFATPPISTGELYEYVYGKQFDNTPDVNKLPYWDMHTAYGEVYGTGTQYITSKDKVLSDIKKFMRKES